MLSYEEEYRGREGKVKIQQIELDFGNGLPRKALEAIQSIYPNLPGIIIIIIILIIQL